jgi:hypothetical protein
VRDDMCLDTTVAVTSAPLGTLLCHAGVMPIVGTDRGDRPGNAVRRFSLAYLNRPCCAGGSTRRITSGAHCIDTGGTDAAAAADGSEAGLAAAGAADGNDTGLAAAAADVA